MRLAIITSHPIQYNAPWFRLLAQDGRRGALSAESNAPGALRVFYLWNGANQLDHGFGVSVKWDIPLLEGYENEFVPNTARNPGPGAIRGLNNPTLADRVEAFGPDAILLFGYNYLSHYRFLCSRIARRVPLLFRGDSHVLGRGRRTEDRGQRTENGGQRTEDRATSPRPSPPEAERGWPSKFLSPSPYLRRFWIASVFRRFSAFLYVGQANKEYFQYLGVPERKLFFAPHAVDNERFMSQAESAQRQAMEWRKELGIPENHKVILFAGKFEPKKRPGDLMAAFRAAKPSAEVRSSKIGVRDRTPNSELLSPATTLLLVGSGQLERELRAQVAGATDIVFAPFQNQSQMPRTYAAADLFVLPSYGPGETWGLAINEAMCMGKPIIVSDHVGCARDLVRDGENGLVFRAGDVAALSDALRHALCAERLDRWGKRSLEIIRSYSYEQTTKGLLGALEFVLPQRKAQKRFTEVNEENKEGRSNKTVTANER